MLSSAVPTMTSAEGGEVNGSEIVGLRIWKPKT